MCEVSTLFYHQMYHDLAQKSCDALDSEGRLDVLPLPEHVGNSDIDRDTAANVEVENDQSPGIWPVSQEDVAYLHHTSGTSTGLPKPIPQSHHAGVYVLPNLDKDQGKATFSTTPLYHGGIADCFRAWTSGALIWLFPGREVPITATTILKSLDCAQRAERTASAPNVQYFSSVPYVLQMMATEAEGMQRLKEMEIVGVGGAALPQQVGDDLVQQGVSLVSRFGSAECGFLMSSHRRYKIDEEWQYLRCRSPHISFEPQGEGSNLAELVVRSTWPHMAKRNRDNGCFATADLFEKHPTIADAWRYHSRSDSQLTLATGKKFDPAPLEAAISTFPLLKEVLIFGNGEQHPGALLFRSKESANLTGKELLETVWPDIERLNSGSQSHARLSKDMLVCMPTDSPSLEKSSKGTVMRGPAEKQYAAEISKAYRGEFSDAESASQNGDHPTPTADEAVPMAVVGIIKEVIGEENRVPKDVDLFSYGVDSTACMRIRALLQKTILAGSAVELPLNIVYDCGTIRRLCQYLVKVRNGEKIEQEDETLQMSAYVSQYGTFKDFSNQPAVTKNSSNPYLSHEAKGEVVILTGATGALGAYVLSQLRSSPRISKIHCLVRAGSLTAAIERVSKSLVARNKAPLDEVSSAKITCHPCKLSDSLLGLSSSSISTNADNGDLYDSLSNSATIIIHAAWAVNFSMRLSSFVKDHIAGLHNLIKFALACSAAQPPRFIFCSSTASVLGPKADPLIPERISHDPLSASPLGYSRSKWVAERICEEAHFKTRLRRRISVLRIGQLCGDTESGIWNVTEAWPIMLSSIKVTNSLPDLSQTLDWLPIDIAAEAVVETALSNAPTVTTKEEPIDIPVLHILNPNTQPTWSALLHWLQRLSPNFDILPPADWLQRIENLSGKAAKHPARKLLGLWKDAYVKNGEAGGNENKKIFEMGKTEEAVSAMRDVQPIGEAQFEKIWVWIEREMMSEKMG